MKRPLIFLVAAPVLVAAAVFLAFVLMDRSGIAKLLAVALFLFTLPVSVVVGTLDGCLARAFPILLRAPLIAAAGAIGASGLAFILFSELLPPEIWPVFALGGAACAGLCSLLANDYGGTPAGSVHCNACSGTG